MSKKRSPYLSPDFLQTAMIGLVVAGFISLFVYKSLAGVVVCGVLYVLLMTIFKS